MPLDGRGRPLADNLLPRGTMLHTATRDPLISRVRSEYSELPGLRLSLWQAQRLYGITRDEAERTLNSLVRAGFLRLARDGSYVRG